MLQKEIKKFFEPHPNIWTVYLFGSHAKNKATRQSDVDLAILCDPKNVPNFDTQMELRESLGSLLKKDVDLVVMNTTNSILKHQVYKHAKVLLNINRRFSTAFWVKSLVDYCDLKIARAIIEKKILNRKVYG